MKTKNFKSLNFMVLALAFCLVAPVSFADDYSQLSDQKINEIADRVNKMSFEQLNARRSELLVERASYQESDGEAEGGSSGSAASSGRLAEIMAELSAIQKALIAIAGLGAISALTDDGYNDNVPPVITILGDNPATVELGTSYTDAGATAFDEFHGETPVESSGSVDTSVVGSYTITYSATDKDANTATATRTVNVTDTIAPVFTSPSTFIIDENQTAVGTVTATDLDDVTFTISGDVLQITAAGVLSFITAPDFESQSSFEYDGSTMDISATVTATDASGNAATQDITVKVRDVGGIDDNPNTGTGTGTGTGTVAFPSATGTALNPTSTGTEGTGTTTQAVATGTGTGTATREVTVGGGTGTGTGTSTFVTGGGTEATGTGTQGTGTGTTGTGTGTGTGAQ